MQGLGCTVSYPAESAGARGSSREVAALLTLDHPSSAPGVPVVTVGGEAVSAKEIATVMLYEAPVDGEAEALVRSARMNGYKVQSPR